MNTTVFVLISLVSNGHWGNYVVPTIEFKKDAEIKSGTANLRCVKIEK